MYIMSCSEVMYQAYYPYLYQRAGAAPPVSAHPVPRTGPFSSPFGAAHQYDRFNVQRLHQDAHSLSQPGSSTGAVGVGLGDAHTVSGHTHPLYLQGSAHSSGGSVSSTGGASPTSPLRPGKEEDCSLHGRSSTEDPQHGVDDDDSQEAGSSRAQYVSANCVVFTHYQGDAASVVDEHFSRALDKTSTHTKGMMYRVARWVVAGHPPGDAGASQQKIEILMQHYPRNHNAVDFGRGSLHQQVYLTESSPMSARNFPPSFWNSQHYSGASGSGHHGASAADLYSEHYHPGDAWYQYSQHHRAVHDYHHHNMAAQYGGLLLPGSRLHMTSHAPCKAMDWQHPSIESPYSSYPTMSGLEAQVQDSSKDLYWF